MVNMKSLHILSSNLNIILLTIWFLNDVFLKTAFPGFITGKLSDLIGIYLSPFLLTAFFSLFLKVKEGVLFVISSILILSLFSFLNISQNWNDLFYSSLSLGTNAKGMADVTDLYCLAIFPLSVLKFYKTEIFTKHSFFERGVLFFSILVFINTSPIPTGRSDLGDYLLLTTFAKDIIILETPVEKKSVESSELFTFRFISKENLNSPLSLETLEIPAECEDVNEEPILREYPANGSSNSSLPSMLFMNYKIRVFQDKDVSNFVFEKTCETQSCLVDLTSIPAGEFYWNVTLRYTFIEECKRYRFEETPYQILGEFLR